MIGGGVVTTFLEDRDEEWEEMVQGWTGMEVGIEEGRVEEDERRVMEDIFKLLNTEED